MRFRYDKTLGKVVPVEAEEPSVRVQIMSDLPAYISPLSEPGKPPIVIDGRAARREELRRNNLREVDPSEWKGNR